MYNRYEKQLNGPPPKDSKAKRSNSSTNVGTMNNLVQDVLERQLRGANERLAALMQQKQESESKWAALLDESNKKCAEFSQQNEQLRASQMRIDTIVNAHLKTIEDLNGRLEARNRKLEKARADHQQVNEKANAQAAELANLRTRADALQKQLDARSSQMERLSVELKAALAAKTEAENARRDLDRRFNNVQATLNDEIKEVGRLRDRERDTYAELERLSALLARKENDLVAEKRRCDELLRASVQREVLPPPPPSPPTQPIPAPAPVATATATTPVLKASVCTQTKTHHLDSLPNAQLDGNTNGSLPGERNGNSDPELRKKYEIALIEIRRLQRELRKCDERFNDVQMNIAQLKQSHRRLLERVLLDDWRSHGQECACVPRPAVTVTASRIQPKESAFAFTKRTNRLRNSVNRPSPTASAVHNTAAGTLFSVRTPARANSG